MFSLYWTFVLHIFLVIGEALVIQINAKYGWWSERLEQMFPTYYLDFILIV